jgi:hypothetical protein
VRIYFFMVDKFWVAYEVTSKLKLGVLIRRLLAGVSYSLLTQPATTLIFY